MSNYETIISIRFKQAVIHMSYSLLNLKTAMSPIDFINSENEDFFTSKINLFGKTKFLSTHYTD